MSIFAAGGREFWHFKAQLLQGCNRGGGVGLGEDAPLTLAGSWVSKDTCKHRGQGLQPLDPSVLSPKTPYAFPSLHCNTHSWYLLTESIRRCRSCNWSPSKGRLGCWCLRIVWTWRVLLLPTPGRVSASGGRRGSPGGREGGGKRE